MMQQDWLLIKFFILKSKIPTIEYKTAVGNILTFNNKDYKVCLKKETFERTDSQRIASFREKLNTTVPFYLANAQEFMKKAGKGRSKLEKEAIEECINFLLP